MQRLFKIFITVILGSVLSCSEELKPTPYTYTKLFTGENNKTWKIKLLESTVDGEIDERGMLPCLDDERFIFYANAEHSFEVFTGSAKCYENPPEEDRYADSWTFNNATSALLMVVPYISDLTLPYLVREADEEEMIVEIFFDQENTVSIRVHLEAVDEE